MIEAHCGNEAGIAVAVATTLGSVPVAFALFGARLGELIDRQRKRT